MFKLVIQDDEGKTTIVPLIRDEITIGRKEGNTIRLTERNVSRRHARILRNNGEVHIEDLGSYNGIRVNNARIAERVSLRVSDQVQIGDYKLYLKAEGLEQVDSALTTPLERIENGAPTDIHASVPPPTQPMPIPPSPSPVPGTPAMVGNPARTMVAVADTDPHGRPLASPAVVAALAQPTGYGKLVVLSSNFAGKEFELSRPQMIVGRTDENDLVINHRSISRNHAKLVREPETGRYTISDLQSSNGVRVNGQDYGKVELRRGDVIDLGHVRLRFVEPGEDFVFSRDAVITDVPDATSRRGLMVVIALVVLAVAAVTVFLLNRPPADDNVADKEGSGTAGSTLPEVTPDATAVAGGSETPAQPAVDVPDAGSSAVAPADRKGELNVRCNTAASEKNWVNLRNCAAELEPLDPVAAKRFIDRASKESKAEAAYRNLGDAIKEVDIKAARAELAKIGSDTVYHKDGETAFKKFRDNEVAKLETNLRSARDSKSCTVYNQLLKVDNEIAEEARRRVGRCVPEQQATVRPTPPKDTPPKDTPPKDTPPKDTPPKDTPPEPSCDGAAFLAQGDATVQSGNHAQGLALFESGMRCKGAPAGLLVRAYMAACNAGNAAKAKQYFLRIPTENQTRLSQICIRNGIIVP